MVKNILKKIIGSRNSRLIKRMRLEAVRINDFEASLSEFTDDALRAKTDEFRERLQSGEALDELLPESFAVVREAAKRTLGMRLFDVQLIGGITLHEGKISEMRTGEGKTLVATMPAYLNALSGKGVHVVTVNDYLARRDAEWMGKVYNFLGMTVGVIVSDQDPDEKRKAYASDITYGTNNEYGFDYLRDNMAFRPEERFQRGLNYAIIDEVDSILIDEARTPLIISGPAEESTDLYVKINTIIPKLEKQESEEAEGDYTVDEKAKQAYLTDSGHEKVESLLLKAGMLDQGSNLYDAANIALMHHINAALRAHVLYQREVDYIVQNDAVVIIDEFTGRMMAGRRWSEGLHQAIEAKENVSIQNENQTLASITFQNYFRLYDKLSGMTGTADTEAFEFQHIYGLEVVVIPTHMLMVRNDYTDQIYRTLAEKDNAILQDIIDCHKRGQPVLVGTISIESSEHLARLLKKNNVPHEVLNAKQHEREAHIITQAGRTGAVTLATNMAGRGTDIVLGGNLEALLAEVGEDSAKQEKIRQKWQQRHQQVLDTGGLHVIGTERHESRRIDNQLRGRSGRQGDPGSSRFYLSLEDNLMRIFGSDRIGTMMQKLGMQEGESIEHPWVSKAIENAQRKVEGRNFDIRKQLLEYDDVANEQRKVVYQQRNELMETETIGQSVQSLRAEVVNGIIDQYIPPQSLEEQWDVPGLESASEAEFAINAPIQEWLQNDDTLHEDTLREKILTIIEDAHKEKTEAIGQEVMEHLEQAVMLQTLDRQWKDHLAGMDFLRQGIHLRGYAQKNPKEEYKREAFALFSEMLDRIKHDIITTLAQVQVQDDEDVAALERQRAPASMDFVHPDLHAPMETEDEGGEGYITHQPIVRDKPKIGRNQPCPCGSGKKYKHCHGRL